jgi:hypothetical protein
VESTPAPTGKGTDPSGAAGEDAGEAAGANGRRRIGSFRGEDEKMSNPDPGEPSMMSNGKSFETSEKERFDENPEQTFGDLFGRNFDRRYVRELGMRRAKRSPLRLRPGPVPNKGSKTFLTTRPKAKSGPSPSLLHVFLFERSKFKIEGTRVFLPNVQKDRSLSNRPGDADSREEQSTAVLISSPALFTDGRRSSKHDVTGKSDPVPSLPATETEPDLNTSTMEGPFQ